MALAEQIDIITEFTQRLQVAVIGAEETTDKHEKWVEGTETETIPTANGPLKTLRGQIAEWRLSSDSSVQQVIDSYSLTFEQKMDQFDDDFVNYLLTIGFEPAVLYGPGILIERRAQTVAFNGVTYYWGGTLPYTTTGDFGTETNWLIAPIMGGVEIPQMSFASGGNIVRKTQSVLGADGEWYYWTGSFPKLVAPGSTVESAGGVGQNKFKLSSGVVPLRPLMKIVASSAGLVLNPGSFEYGATISSETDALPHFGTGKLWRWGGVLPKVVDVGSEPLSSGGVGPSQWIEVSTAGGTNAGITISEIPPTGVALGHRWYCTSDGRTYIRYLDSDSVQWVEESPQGSVFEGLEPRINESLRRSYAEAGYNVVGTFQAGFTYVNANDVGIDLATGKGYTGPAGAVAAGTNPAGGGFVDRSDDVRVSGSIDAILFGVDPSGTLASDAQLLDALQFSAASGIEIVVSGKCRLTQTMMQPANSIVRVDGVVFCEDPTGLTDSLLWDVSGSNDSGCRTEIRAMTLSTSPTTGAAVVDRLMKPIRVSTARVKCGAIKTFGFQLAGPEIGPTGFEISVAESTSVIKQWDTAHRDACGFKLTTTDCEIGSIITTNYPVAPKLGSTNHINSVHCWGLPATAANEYPNAQMLTGPTLGAATVVDHIYVDSLDTEGYNTAPSGNEGVGVLFAGFECSVGALVYRVHPQTKPGKIKLGRFTGYSNSVSSLQVPGGAGFDTAAPFIYDNDAAKWRNRIDMSNVQSIINRFTYTTELVPSGFTAFSGTMTVEKVGHDALIKLFFTASSVNNSSTDDFVINLPAGLSLLQGTTALVSQRTCLLMSDTDHTLTNDFAYVDGSSKVRIAYRKRNTGQLFFLKQTALVAGIIELTLRASITNQM